jgi:hypothetical protein
VLTAEELENYLEQHAGDESLHKLVRGHFSNWNSTIYDRLCYLLARRFVRDNRWEKAKEYLPVEWRRWENWHKKETNPKEILGIYLKNISSAKDSHLPKRERAKKYFEAARLMRKYGIELMGTELDPDWFYFNGGYVPGNYTKRRFGEYSQGEIGLLKGSRDEQKKVLNSLPNPNKRFHYRYYAAELMWKCAELLPDNDHLLAQALYEGGNFLKLRDPKYADKFYKALVNRCRKLPVGQFADELRWFPCKEDYERLMSETVE